MVVSFDSKPYAFNPQCLIPAPEESVDFDPKSKSIIIVLSDLLTILHIAVAKST